MIKNQNPALAIVVLIGSFLLVTSAFYPLGFLSVFDAKRLLQLALFVVLMVFAATWTPLRKKTNSQLSRLSPLNGAFLGIFFFIGIISSLRLDHPSYALVDVSMMFVMMILIFVTAASRELAGKYFDEWAVVLLTATGLAVATQEFMGFVAGWISGFEFNYNHALVHFAHPRFYNQLQTWSIPVIAALPLLFPGKRRIKIICIVLLGLQWFLVIAVAARGTIVSLLTAMTFIAFWLPAYRKFWLNYQLAGLVTGVLIYSGILLGNGLLIPNSQSGEFFAYSVGRPMAHTSGRSTLWRLSIEDAIKQPVLGTGPTRYACNTNNKLPAHPHNFLFRIMGEWGLIATLALLILAVTVGLGFLKKLKYKDKTSQTDPPLKAIVATSLIAGVMHACLSGVMIMPASQVAMILIGGWALSLVGNSLHKHQYSNVASSLIVMGTLLACIQFLFSIYEISNLPQRTSYSVNYGPLVPRFWQDGRVCEYRYATSLTTQ